MSGEEIPLHPFDPNTEEHADEHEHETSFGGGNNTDFNPDDYDTDGQRRNAKRIIDALRRYGFPAPTDLYYYDIDGKTPLVSEDKRNWYLICKGYRNGAVVLGLTPYHGAIDTPDSLKLKFGLETSTEVARRRLAEMEEEKQESEEFLRQVFNDPKLNEVFHGKDEFNNTWVSLKAKNSAKFVVNENGTLSNLDGKASKPSKSLLDYLGKTNVEVLGENEKKD